MFLGHRNRAVPQNLPRYPHMSGILGGNARCSDMPEGMRPERDSQMALRNGGHIPLERRQGQRGTALTDPQRLA